MPRFTVCSLTMKQSPLHEWKSRFVLLLLLESQITSTNFIYLRTIANNMKSRKSRLLTLPAELRDEIYQLTIPSDLDGCVNEVPVLVKVCRQTRKEISRWIKARVRDNGVVLHYSTRSAYMDIKSLKLLRFCMNFSLENQPLFNSVKQFHINFSWVQNATDEEGRPKFCFYFEGSFGAFRILWPSSGRCDGTGHQCTCDNPNFSKYFDSVILSVEHFCTSEAAPPRVVDGVFDMATIGARTLSEGAYLRGPPPKPVGEERNAVCPSTWFPPPHKYTKPLLHFRRWLEISHTDA